MHPQHLGECSRKKLLKKSSSYKMLELPPVHTVDDSARDVYLEFSFFDGVMVECGDISSPEWRPWESRMNLSRGKKNAHGVVNVANTGVKDAEQLPSCTVFGLSSPRNESVELHNSSSEDCESSLKSFKGETCSYMPLRFCVSGGHFKSREKHESSKGDVKLDADDSLALQSISEGSSSRRSFATGTRDISHVEGECSEEEDFHWKHHSHASHTGCDGNGPYTRNEFGCTPMHHFRGSFKCGAHSNAAAEDFSSVINNNNGHFRGVNIGSLKGGSGWYLPADNRKICQVASGSQHEQLVTSSQSSLNSNQGNIHMLYDENEKYGTVTTEVSGDLSPLRRVCIGNRQIDVRKDSGKLPLAAWATIVSGRESPRCSSMSMTDLVEAISPGKCPQPISPGISPRPIKCKKGSTLASRLELTGAVLAECKSHDFLRERDPVSPVSPLQSSSPASNSPFKRHSAGFKLEPRNLSIVEPVPYGVMHGLLHCTLREGLPNYTFLLDDYEEVVTAKIWMEDMLLGEAEGAWRYTFYSLRGEGKKKGKMGWKHWKRKEKLASRVVGKMKVSSALHCDPGFDKEKNLAVQSEFILYSARPQEPSVVPHANLSSAASSSSVEDCSKATYNINTKSTFRSSTSTSSGSSHLSSTGAISAWYVTQSLLPSSFVAPDMEQKHKSKHRKWGFQSGISGSHSKTAKKNNQSSSSSCNDANAKNTSEMTLKQGQNFTELAAMIINVPIELQDKGMPDGSMSKKGKSESQGGCVGLTLAKIWEEGTQECVHSDRHGSCNGAHSRFSRSNRQANITVILPSGNHGRPLSDSKGPSPLITRWKDGGKCDCKGWDLGCGLLVLSNGRTDDNGCEFAKLRQIERQGMPLMLYKQDSDQNDAFISLAPQENGLIALDFRAPLSPLQAFAIAVGILHGRVSGIPDVNTAEVAPDLESPKEFVADRLCGERNCSPVDKCNKDNAVRIERNKTAGHVIVSPDPNMVKCDDVLRLHNSLCHAHLKVQGTDVLNYGSELALTFERV